METLNKLFTNVSLFHFINFQEKQKLNRSFNLHLKPFGNIANQNCLLVVLTPNQLISVNCLTSQLVLHHLVKIEPWLNHIGCQKHVFQFLFFYALLLLTGYVEILQSIWFFLTKVLFTFIPSHCKFVSAFLLLIFFFQILFLH